MDPLHMPLTEAELSIRRATAPSYRNDAFPGWTLAVVNVHHGLPRTAPGLEELRVPWLHDANALAMLELTLRAPQPDGRRVSALIIGSGPLKVLCASLHERGLSPAAWGVKLIGTVSYRLSTHWKRLVERSFGAQVFDNYSLSEVGTPFTSCPTCGALHMGHPPVLWELLELNGPNRVTRGPGRLVMTTLFPFSQLMPLVRYDTGDIAVRTPVCPATHLGGLRVLGRRRHGLTSPRGEFILNPVDVRDVLEDYADVERTLHPMTRLGHVKSRDLGPPRWRADWEDGAAVLRFEVRFDPHVYSERALSLESEVRRALCTVDPFTRAVAREGRLRVEALMPGALAPFTERYD